MHMLACLLRTHICQEDVCLLLSHFRLFLYIYGKAYGQCCPSARIELMMRSVTDGERLLFIC